MSSNWVSSPAGSVQRDVRISGNALTMTAMTPSGSQRVRDGLAQVPHSLPPSLHSSPTFLLILPLLFSLSLSLSHTDTHTHIHTHTKKDNLYTCHSQDTHSVTHSHTHTHTHTHTRTHARTHARTRTYHICKHSTAERPEHSSKAT